MKARFGLLVLAAALVGTVGCGDDDVTPMDDAGGGMVDAGPGGMDGSVMAICPPGAPPPDNQMGACCSRASNASDLDSPELRIAGIRVSSPASLGSTIIRGLLTGALDEERFAWLIRIEGAPTTGMGPITVKTGFGFRDASGSYAYAMGNAPAPGAVDRWDPKTFPGTMSGEMFSAPRTADIINLPIFDNPDDAGAMPILFELPLRNLELIGATLSENRSCVGVRNPASWDVMSGNLTGFLTVADTSVARLEIGGILASLCMVISGMSAMPGNCEDVDMMGARVYPQAMWMVKPDSLCGATGCVSNRLTPGTCNPDMDCNAFELQAGFAAQGVDITN